MQTKSSDTKASNSTMEKEDQIKAGGRLELRGGTERFHNPQHSRMHTTWRDALPGEINHGTYHSVIFREASTLTANFILTDNRHEVDSLAVSWWRLHWNKAHRSALETWHFPPQCLYRSFCFSGIAERRCVLPYQSTHYRTHIHTQKTIAAYIFVVPNVRRKHWM